MRRHFGKGGQCIQRGAQRSVGGIAALLQPRAPFGRNRGRAVQRSVGRAPFEGELTGDDDQATGHLIDVPVGRSCLHAAKGRERRVARHENSQKGKPTDNHR
ncbi:hypothetical protein [Azospirillum argentinense]